MAKFTVPREFSSQDDKYFKFFTKETVIVFFILAGISLGIFKVAGLFMADAIPVAIICGIITVIVSITTMIPISADNYMTGGGNILAVLFVKLYIRRKEGCLYVKGNKQWLMDSEAEHLVNTQLAKDHTLIKYKPKEDSVCG